jgi:hypothetical protein
VQIYDTLIIGKSANTEPALDKASPVGINTPRTEFFTIRKVRFHNYHWNGATAIKDCSHCQHSASTDSGGRTVKTEGLAFVNVDRRIKYNTPYTGIFYDLDGSLTELGPNSWAVKDWPHLKHEGCLWDSATVLMYNGMVCKNTVEVRRIAFYG